ncbi:MAG: hypothetical protein ABEJ24_05935 [Candidatus Magasanikbacteria bacterium]
MYDDPRFSDEPEALKRFNQKNESNIISSPDVYDYEIISPNKYWLIMELLPEDAEPFESPLSDSERNSYFRNGYR